MNVIEKYDYLRTACNSEFGIFNYGREYCPNDPLIDIKELLFWLTMEVSRYKKVNHFYSKYDQEKNRMKIQNMLDDFESKIIEYKLSI